MNKSIRKSKSPLKQSKIVDCVSASELLQALNTLEHISTVEQQLSEDLNISFSQKDNFNHTNQLLINPSQSQSTIKTKHSKFNKSNNDKNKKQIQYDDSQGSKMNFQFYMTKKQNKYKNKSTFQIINHKNNTQNIIQKSITPKKKPIQNKLYTHNKSISPLTQRSNNTLTVSKTNNSIIQAKQFQLKNTNLTPSKSQIKHSQKNITTQIKNPKIQTNTNKENQTQINKNNFIQKNIRKTKIPSSLNQLSLHQRNKQYLKQKNQKLAKLCQEIEEKKKQQEKQCTFKPKIISNNSHIKPKYNDLCASRQFYEKTHKRCKTGKQNLQNCFQDDTHSKASGLKDNKTGKIQFQSTLQQQIEFDSTAKMSIQQCNSRVKNSTSVYQKEEQNKSIVKKKYKNSKFNILLDMIH